MLGTLLLLLIVAGWAYWLIALALVYEFFRHRPEPESGFTPPVSILKPIKGVDFQAYENLASFCRQDYPDYEVLFGVADAADPVVPIIEQLRRDFPERAIRLIVAEAFGANRKASLLERLAREAQHDILVVSDSDMRAKPDYLRCVVAPLAAEQVGLVTCPYLGEAALNLTAGLEALHMGATFLPSVVVARRAIAMRFAMGASVALRRRDLDALGGFGAVAGYLADDYQLGARMAASGRQVRMSNYIMACVLGATTFREQWEREVRWMRCAWVSRPLEYPGQLLFYSTPLAALLTVASGFEPLSLRILVASLLWRWLVAWLISLRTGDRQARRWLLWLPLRDLLSAAIWCVAALGRRIVWRGETFVLQPGGRMRPAADLPAAAGRRARPWHVRALQKAVYALDGGLRRALGVFEFENNPDGLLRVRVTRAAHAVALPEVRIPKGAPTLELHLWNEHVPPLPDEGPDLLWAAQVRRKLVASFRALGRAVARDPRFAKVQAVGGSTVLCFAGDGRREVKLFERLGFAVGPYRSPLGRFGEFWENLYTWAIMGAYNAATLRRRRLRQLRRGEIWMTIGEFLSRYGEANPVGDDSAQDQWGGG